MAIWNKRQKVYGLAPIQVRMQRRSPATRADDFVYEADVMITDMQADASLVFRSSVDGWSSYMPQIVPSAGLVRLKDAREGTED